MRSSNDSSSKDSAINDMMLMLTDKSVSLRYKSKKTVLFNQSFHLKETPKRISDVAKERIIPHGVIPDSDSSLSSIFY